MTSPETPGVPADVWWSCVAEPGDAHARALRLALGDEEARQWAGAHTPGPLPEVLTASASWNQWRAAWERWAPRGRPGEAERELEMLDAVGGRLIRPGEPEWPTGVDDLDQPPNLLWLRGHLPRRPTAAVVGARAATQVGARTAHDLGVELSHEGVLVVSGGAFGIDIAAHRGALDEGAPTVVHLAGGLANMYPVAHEDLFEQVVAQGGALVSEVPPTWRPAKWRFLERNRLIAAHCHALVVVEAAMRSGALATARRAMDLGREVGAVPGPVTSPASGGCHELIRRGGTLVRDSRDVLEMLAPVGGATHDMREVTEPLFGTPVDNDRGTDALPPDQRRVWEALPARAGTDLARLSRAAGMAPRQVLTALARLELRGLVRADPRGWARVRSLPSMGA
ncbi:DNA-protecting protein DprA [Schaalia sp. 19OD2882]|uniref:DNA-processing protein DprA n=1 Tax=Schaalia sp. 19OD2882 TaxID=2794089 RepID=UPI001C1EB3C8|nr:DNA-processing protein DprA [Schaalia sp. 19OD2882]QWW18817.1 DNA-protecting protein DprA [Schaalia sp. 19OD2882]